MQQFISEEIQKLSNLLLMIQNDETLLQNMQTAAESFITAIQKGGKIFFAGNGGSAADAQHLATELVCRIAKERPSIPAMALTTDSSVLTAVANDYSFDEIFARQLAGLGKPGDVFVGISTSGNSRNVLRGLEEARRLAITTIGLSGIQAPKMAVHCDVLINVPTKETPKIQECHIMLGHILCSLIENAIYGLEMSDKNETIAHQTRVSSQ